MPNLKALIDVAARRREADLVLKNAQVVNVFTEEVLPADVAVCEGTIAGVGSYTAAHQIDCTGLTLCPGFIDAHIHLESSMVLPAEFVRMALPSGTTTVIADPHEIVNVCGARGMRFMLNAVRGLPCNVLFMLPSCVPATPYETSGAAFELDDMLPFLDDPQVLGLGEVMGFTQVTEADARFVQMLEAFGARPVDGHAPGLTGAALQAYVAAGARTEHESTTFAEAAEKARAGMAVLVREGSAAHNTVDIIRGLLQSGLPQNRFMFCTDDKHLDDLERDGHIRWNVKLAVELGMPLPAAVRMASTNAALAYGLRGLGAIAPGYRADMVLLSDAKRVTVHSVYKDGRPAAECLAALRPAAPVDASVLRTVRLEAVTPARLALPLGEAADVIEMVPYQLATRHLREAVPRENGVFAPNSTYTKLCVAERHGKNGNLAVAPLKGYGITGGALATTVAHDSHNIIAAGDNDADLVLAINRLAQINGGYVLVGAGKVLGEVPLPVAGLMSDAPAAQVQAAIGDIIAKAHAMGIPRHIDPFISLSFMALPVIPSLRLTDRGLFSFQRFGLL